ncbi:phosphatase PAP2 family protein [Catenulispora rubra]|uniref:phosphatase PAP2 family protein n=1 Tax=Catenulispora rubra TaxID=280293 RepID=UPI0018921AC3|nr:phosphatase PAP2 family protein [Catenulispora rubra]
MRTASTLGRRRFLTGSAGTAAALIAAPTIESLVFAGRAAAATTAGSALSPFVEHYTTNVSTNVTADDNAAVRILAGMARLWAPGTAWNTGTVLDAHVLHANMRHSARITKHRTEEQAKQAFIHDRQDQSYGMIDGLGPLASFYKTGAKAVTSITSAPDGTPPTTINDVVPPDAPAGSATGPGSTASDLGAVVALEQTLRGNYSSGNPSKASYSYPRPWRMTEDSTVVDTGATDAFGYPVYKSDVIVAPQLLRQRSMTPATDGGFPSGHTNAFFLAGLAYAYAVPERFQELVTRAFELANSRIVAGMHSAVDVIGGRILGTALAAAILGDPANAAAKSAARAQALAYFTAHTGTTPETLFAYAHSAARSTDPYADREANAAALKGFFTYGLPAGRASSRQPMTVPQGAEVLVETRLPYLDAAQRREVLRTTALPSGHPVLDGPELWGRLNLFAAADGYGSFAQDVRIVMNASAGGFHAADAWRNDIDGHGRLTKSGTGTLTLSGDNEYSGGTTISGGALIAASRTALGTGDLHVADGTLGVKLVDDGPALRISGLARVGEQSSLLLDVTACDMSARDVRRADRTFRVIEACDLRGVFRSITVSTPGFRAEPRYSASGLTVRIRSNH